MKNQAWFARTNWETINSQIVSVNQCFVGEYQLNSYKSKLKIEKRRLGCSSITL